jgi:CBS domain-containing protein
MSESTEFMIAAERARVDALAPFNCLPARLLDDVLTRAAVVFFRHGAIVSHPRIVESAPAVWIVRQGSVRAGPLADDNEALPGGEEILPVGTFLPIEALLGGPPCRIYAAHEDCFLWRVDAPLLERLLAEPAFLRWLALELQNSNRRLREENTGLWRARQIADQALALPVKSVGSEQVVFVPPTASLAEVAATLARLKIGSVAVGAPDAVAGIVTQTDLVRRGLAAGLAPDTAVAAVMTAQPAMIEEAANVLDAAIEMGKQRFRHLLIRSAEGPVTGIVSERDLFRAQQQGLAHIQAPIDEAASVADIVHLATRIRTFAERVFRQGMAIAQFTRMVSSINDRLTRRLLSLIVAERHPDWRFCWLAFGSEGREEQGFVTDQDNGIVFVPPPGVPVDDLRAEYLAMAHEMNEALHAAGFERCKGNIMAGNPEWCLALEEWKRKFSRWVHATTPTAILNSTIFFDFRPIFGAAELAEEMRDHLLGEIRGNSIFIHMLATNALEVAVPLGAMNRFKTESGEHKGLLDLKTQGTRLFVDFARIYALAHGVRAVNTEQRLATVGTRIKRSVSAIEGDIAALRFLQGLRLRRQLDSLTDGKDANRVDPYALNDMDQRMLREALRQAQSLQERLKLDYKR